MHFFNHIRVFVIKFDVIQHVAVFYQNGLLLTLNLNLRLGQLTECEKKTPANDDSCGKPNYKPPLLQGVFPIHF